MPCTVNRVQAGFNTPGTGLAAEQGFCTKPSLRGCVTGFKAFRLGSCAAHHRLNPSTSVSEPVPIARRAGVISRGRLTSASGGLQRRSARRTEGHSACGAARAGAWQAREGLAACADGRRPPCWPATVLASQRPAIDLISTAFYFNTIGTHEHTGPVLPADVNHVGERLSGSTGRRFATRPGLQRKLFFAVAVSSQFEHNVLSIPRSPNSAHGIPQHQLRLRRKERMTKLRWRQERCTDR